MVKQIIKQAGRINGHVAWECLMADGTHMHLTIHEVMVFSRPAR